MTFRDNFLPTYDKIRNTITNQFGLRQYDVSVRIVKWTGSRPGLGTPDIQDIQITANKSSNLRPKVQLVSSREIALSGGKYRDGDFKVSSIIPKINEDTGYDPSEIALTPQKGAEVYFRLKGPGMHNPDGDWFDLVEVNFSKNFEYQFILRKSAKTPPNPSTIPDDEGGIEP